MGFTILDPQDVAPGKAGKSEHALIFYDNPIAIAAGAAGAPKVQNAAIATGAVTNDKVANSTLGAEKLQAGQDEVNWVLARVAATAFDAVGSYVMAQANVGTGGTGGALVAGSQLFASDVEGNALGGGLSGTWRIMGYISGGGPDLNVSLVLRVA